MVLLAFKTKSELEPKFGPKERQAKEEEGNGKQPPKHHLKTQLGQPAIKLFATVLQTDRQTGISLPQPPWYLFPAAATTVVDVAQVITSI